MSMLGPAPEPKTALGHYRILSPSAAVRVSPLCLGAMNFGEAWKEFMGSCDKKTTFEILDYFYEAGGNFIDTSNNYQGEESEKWIGEWMTERGVRDQMVIATKYTTGYRVGHNEITANTTGNGTKSMHVSVEQSLKKLQTDYIDLLWLHWWDYSTSIPEIMQSLNQLVLSGKVLYLGVSDTPAWVVSKANEYARAHGLRQFSVYQGKWNAECRDFERDIIPMTISEGMGLCPWAALGGGDFKTEEERKVNEGRKSFSPLTEKAIKISKVLEGIAKRKNAGHLTSIALAYVMHKTPYVFPIVGGRTVGHLKSNIAALSIKLTKEDMDEIEGAAEFDLGFPTNMLGNGNPRNNFLLQMAGHFDYVEATKSLSFTE